MIKWVYQSASDVRAIDHVHKADLPSCLIRISDHGIRGAIELAWHPATQTICKQTAI